jgi:hypothetical protein
VSSFLTTTRFAHAMDELEFRKQLARFPAVRSRDALHCRAGGGRAAAAAAAAATAAAARAPLTPPRAAAAAVAAAAAAPSAASAAAAAPPLPPPPPPPRARAPLPAPPRALFDGVEALLARHFAPGAARDRAAAAFGEGFYGGLRALNYEDIDDFAATCEREHEEARRERERERERRAAQAQAAGP